MSAVWVGELGEVVVWVVWATVARGDGVPTAESVWWYNVSVVCLFRYCVTVQTYTYLIGGSV